MSDTTETAASAAAALAGFAKTLARDNISIQEVVFPAASYDLFVHCMPASLWVAAKQDGEFLFTLTSGPIRIRRG